MHFLYDLCASRDSPHVLIESFGIYARHIHFVIERDQVGLAVHVEHGGLDTFDVFALGVHKWDEILEINTQFHL